MENPNKIEQNPNEKTTLEKFSDRCLGLGLPFDKNLFFDTEKPLPKSEEPEQTGEDQDDDENDGNNAVPSSCKDIRLPNYYLRDLTSFTPKVNFVLV